MDREGQTVTLRDGRSLGYADYGDPAGAPVFFFHGTPGSRLGGRVLGDAASRRHVRLIAVDRPGFGLSDFQKRRRILDWPDYVAQLAGTLGIGRFGVAGLSGGGPHVAACALKLRDRLTVAMIISGATPPEARSAGHGWARRMLTRIGTLILGPIVRVSMAHAAFWASKVGPALMPRWIDRRVTASRQNREALRLEVVEGFRRGSGGASYDFVMLVKPWGFRLDDIAMPVHLWHGEADRVVPARYARAMMPLFADPRVRWFPGEGHLLIMEHAEEIIAVLAAGR
ncbi:MAG: alpha/beta hydrolase [Dehalococcoidia bacterium]